MRAFIHVFLFTLCDFVQHAVNPPGQRVHEDDLEDELNDTKEEAWPYVTCILFMKPFMVLVQKAALKTLKNQPFDVFVIWF